MNNPKVSIIMPVYNSGSYLKMAVDSILNQNFRDFELILVDDGSTDGSAIRCDKYAQDDNRVVVIHQKNGGICNARNTALEIAKGEYIGFSDHDDEFLPGAFEAINQKLADTNADVIKFGKRLVNLKEGKKIREWTYQIHDCILDKSAIREMFYWLKNHGILNSVWDGWFHKSLFEHNKFNEYHKGGGEDMDIMYDIICDTNKLVLMDAIYYIHYTHKGFSTSSKFDITKINTIKSLTLKMNKTLKRLGINRDNDSFEYSYCLLKYGFFPIVNILSNDLCRFSYKEKVMILKDMIKEDCTPSYFLTQSVLAVFKRSKKIGLGYFLLKNSLYHILFKMFNYRGKHS